MEITEKQYLEAVKIVIDYTEMVKKNTEKVLIRTGIKNTPEELADNWHKYFPNMEVRLINILKFSFPNTRLCDITKKQFLSARNAGEKSWSQLCELTNNNEM